MQKLALGIEYDGSMYCGWQKQKCGISIQSCVEYALSKLASEAITIFGAGRTDSGVHALEQVVHFETSLRYSESAWTLGVNRYLPSSICIRWVSLVSNEFHARFSAVSRRYYYCIYNDRIRSAIYFRKTWNYQKFLNIHKMLEASQCLLGENDFSAFRSAGCQSHSSHRRVDHLYIVRQGKYIIIDIKANAFLYRMVRNIVGSLVEVGCGKKPVTWMLELLQSCKKSAAVITAPSHGLYLAEIQYPDCLFMDSKII